MDGNGDGEMDEIEIYFGGRAGRIWYGAVREKKAPRMLFRLLS